jgi:ribosomal protein L4
MPKKVRLLGLKVALTASLYDRKVRIIDSEVVSSGKTRELLA